jgi:tetratricopeptide (TPR) repeat protein
MMALQKKDFNGAIQIFNQLIQQNPQYAQGYFYLGLAYQGAGNFQQALTMLNTASQDESLRLNCYKTMGDIYIQMGNPTEASKLYQAAGLTPQ